MRFRMLLLSVMILAMTMPVYSQSKKKTPAKKQAVQVIQHASMDASERMRLHLAPGEKVINIAAAAFTNTNPQMSQWSNQGNSLRIDRSGGSTTFVAPLVLPNGSRITRLAACANELQNNYVGSVKLMRQKMSLPEGVGDDLEEIASVTFSGTPGKFILHLVKEVDDLTIDTLNHTYFFQLHLEYGSSFRSVMVFYREE